MKNAYLDQTPHIIGLEMAIGEEKMNLKMNKI